MRRTDRLDTVYPPRGMRCERASAYLDMSEASFLRLVAEKALPPGTEVRGMVLWDRLDLDRAFEIWKAKQGTRNTVNAALGIPDD